MTTTTDTLQNKISREIAAFLFAFVQKPETVIWREGSEFVESLECSPGHVQFMVCTHDGESRMRIGTSNTSVAGLRELGRLAASIIEDRRAVMQFKNETINATVAGCDIELEFFEESGEQRSSLIIERNGYSASLTCAENEGVLHCARRGDRPIGDSIVNRIRRWAEARGY